MMQPTDPLFDALSGLAPLTPRASHAARIRRRCARVLAEQRGRRTPPPAIYLADVISGAAVAAYVIAVVTAAVRLLAAS